MRPELRTLILDYQARVTVACRLIRERLGVTIDHQFSWRQPGIPMQGWLDDQKTIEYMFHGIGCAVYFGTTVVDFDFGPNGRFDGFDAWRLSLFARSVPQYQQFVDYDRLHQELTSLHQVGELVIFSLGLDAHLFYLPDSHPETPRPGC